MHTDTIPDENHHLRALMADIENKFIDKSEWSSRKQPIVNAFRASKGDIAIETDCPQCHAKGFISGRRCETCKGTKRVGDTHIGSGESSHRYAQVQVRSILNWLYEDSKVTPSQVDAAYSYQIWRDYFHAMWSGRQSGACWFGLSDAFGAGEPITERNFLVLLQKLTRKDQRLVDIAIDTFANPHSTWLVSRQIHLYISALQRLERLIDFSQNYPLTQAPGDIKLQKE